MKPLFYRSVIEGYVLAALLLFSLVSISVDIETRWLKPVRGTIDILLMPLRFLVEAPYRGAVFVDAALTSRQELIDRIKVLERENLSLSLVAQQARSWQSDLNRLRATIDSGERVADTMRLAEVVAVTPNQDLHELVIDKGEAHGLSFGLAVVDASGLVGQISEIGPRNARVLLVSDARHAVPVENQRSGIRSIVVGVGHPGRLQIIGLAATADIAPGDRLVTSGLGDRFPRGYPVGSVEAVSYDRSSEFSTVLVKPAAQLDRSGLLLVVLPGKAAE